MVLYSIHCARKILPNTLLLLGTSTPRRLDPTRTRGLGADPVYIIHLRQSAHQKAWSILTCEVRGQRRAWHYLYTWDQGYRRAVPAPIFRSPEWRAHVRVGSEQPSTGLPSGSRGLKSRSMIRHNYEYVGCTTCFPQRRVRKCFPCHRRVARSSKLVAHWQAAAATCRSRSEF